VGANCEYARSLLLRLEHDSANIKIASRKQALQTDLQAKRELIKRLQSRLQELNQLEDDDDSSEDEDDMDSTPSYAPAVTNASNGIDTEGSSAQEAAANLSSTLRSRNRNAQESNEPSATTTQSNRYGSTFQSSTKTDETTSLQNRETLLSAHRSEQESITESLITLAQQLKSSAQNFSISVENEKDVLERATSGLDKNVTGMETAGQRMGTLRRMTEGRGWWGRMLMYAWIGGLWVVALVVVFVLPKLRF